MSEVIYVDSRSVAVGDHLCYRDSGSGSMHDAVSRKPAGVNPPSGVRMRTYDGAVVWTYPLVAPPAAAEIDPHILPPRISIDSSQKYVLEPILIYSFGETKLLTQVVEPEDHPV